MSEWVAGEVIDNIIWTEQLHSLKIRADGIRFVAGQYTRLALDVEGVRVARPYSFVNAPDADYLEFFFNSVPNGPLSNRLLAKKAGDRVWVSNQTAGFLTLSEVPEGKELLLMATGTALGPFLSILNTVEPWERFERIVMAYAVRYANELCYRKQLDALAQLHATQFTWVPFVSREPTDFALPGRIPPALLEGVLEQRVGMRFDPAQSQVMICGNPYMVKDSLEALKTRGFEKNLRRKAGQVTVERYW